MFSIFSFEYLFFIIFSINLVKNLNQYNVFSIEEIDVSNKNFIEI
jgi:hypothetical protein